MASLKTASRRGLPAQPSRLFCGGPFVAVRSYSYLFCFEKIALAFYLAE